ncbi:MAG: hypothetical protein ACYTBS_11215 [Planctomycetota bacterium]|jgi:hypothetical protein
MELKKRSSSCTEDNFWECVAEIGWSKDVDTSLAKRACLIAWTPEFGKSFREILEKRESEVYRRFLEFEKMDLSKRERDMYYMGDDSFGDFCSHVVGMGREVFMEEMENPRKLFERAKDGKYWEKFSYCIPYEPHPDTTWEKWVEMHRYATTEEEFEAERRYRDSDESFEEYMDNIRRSHKDWQMGDWAYLDPGHYVPLARRYHTRCGALVAALSSQESLTKEERQALDFATMLMGYFGALDLGKTEAALEASEGALQAWWGLYHIAEDLGALRKAHIDLLPMVSGVYGGENTINDHRRYMGGLEGFGCRHHLKMIREAAA